MRLAALATVAAVALGSLQAQAQVVRGEDKVVYKKITTVDITEVEIGAGRAKPNGDYLSSHKRPNFKSLIALRTDFNPELQKSVERIQP
jgi:hypothetical protein